jgi:octopine/nopaline transport system substrate-binding protein
MRAPRALAAALLGTAALLAAAGASAQGKKPESIRIASEGAYAPWNFSGPTRSSWASRSTSPTTCAGA